MPFKTRWPHRQPQDWTAEHRRYRAGLVAQLKREGYLLCTARSGLPQPAHHQPQRSARDGLHAGHDDSGKQYDGRQHNACNVKDGARRGRAKQSRRATSLRW